MSTYIFGHKNPDTDAICSALAYADLLRRTTRPEAKAACCGEINIRTKFALDEAGIQAPGLMMDVRPTVSTIVERDAPSAREDESLYEAFNRLRNADYESLPVLDSENRVLGLVSLAKLVEMLLPDPANVDRARLVSSTLAVIAGVLDAQVHNALDMDKAEDLIITVGALSSAKFTERIQHYAPEKLLVISGDRPTVLRAAIDYGVRCLLVTGGNRPDDALMAIAREKGVTVLTSPHDTASTSTLVKCSNRIGLAIERDVLTFAEGTLLQRVADQVRESEQTVFPVVDDNRKLIGCFDKAHLLHPPVKQLILVDHNELAQAVNGADEANILEVLDHHRLGGGLISREPIRFLCEPVGSTCTIVSNLYRKAGIEPDRGIALCLCAGIISDTLYLTSPTTTEVDRDVLGWLRGLHGLDLDKFTEDFFAAGSALQNNTPEEIVTGDCKRYEENGWNLAIAQVEEQGLERFWPLKDKLSEAVNAFRERESLDFSALLITDITTHDSYLITTGSERIQDAIDYPKVESGLYHLAGIVSRKKQLLPHIASTLAGIPKGE